MARPMVDTKGFQKPAHLQLNMKKLQLQEERLATIERDNLILSTKLSDIMRSKGQVDHRNNYPERSLNVEKRHLELLLVTRENQAILERIEAQESDYRRQHWEEDWARTERLRDDIARYPRGVTNQQKNKRRVKFHGSEKDIFSKASGHSEESTGTSSLHEHTEQ
ncbi:sperm axonemal maintenance protein CFAP97D1 isoform X2 [Amia ocellicauda]